MCKWLITCIGFLLVGTSFGQVTPQLEYAGKLARAGQHMKAFALYNSMNDTSENAQVPYERAKYLGKIYNLKKEVLLKNDGQLPEGQQEIDSVLSHFDTDTMHSHIESELNRCLTLHATHADAIERLAELKFHQGRLEESMQDYKRLAKYSSGEQQSRAQLNYEKLKAELMVEVPADVPSCSIYQNGKFKGKNDEGEMTLTRSGTTQTEYYHGSKLTVKSTIKWVSDCEYELTYVSISQKSLHSWMKGSKANVKIIPIDETHHRVATTYRGKTDYLEFVKIE